MPEHRVHLLAQAVPAPLAPGTRLGTRGVERAAGREQRHPSVLTYLLVTGRLNPGWDYLVYRKFSSLWRDVPGTAIGADLQTFITAPAPAGTPNGSPQRWPPK